MTTVRIKPSVVLTLDQSALDSKEFNFDGQTYICYPLKHALVPDQVATAWVSFDSDMEIFSQS